ncbi:MAG: DUF1553 domain-containing protein, partial [Gammaproteobacteria bacterium]
PSHPELLDWLATEFLARRGSFKSMHRLILRSSTYRQSSRFNPHAAGVDPENRLFWRMNTRRLEAELIRDSILAASGQLNREMGGPGIYPRIDPSVISTGSTHKWPVDVREGPAQWRRSVYVFVKRSVILPMIEVFDCPDTTVSSPARSSSTVAPQALALLNNEFVLAQSRSLAGRVVQEAGADTRARIQYAYRLALGRSANANELKWGLDFLSRQAKGHWALMKLAGKPAGARLPAPLSGPTTEERTFAADWGQVPSSPSENPALKAVAPDRAQSPELAALRDFCHALFNLSEFLYVD